MLKKRELQKVEDKLKVRYYRLSKVFLVIAILFVIWVVIVALGIVIYEFKHTWSLLSLEYWIYAWCILIGFFIFLEFVFYLHYMIIRKKRVEGEKPKPEYYDDKRVYIYTHPKDAEGGIFSKTYVKIDENSVLRLRTLMIPPSDLWSKKE